MKRVVVTGLGLVSPLGNDAHAMFHRLLKGECGIQSLSHDPLFKDLPVQIAAKVKDSITINYEEESKLSNFMKYAMAATDFALKDAEWHALPNKDTGVCIGSGIGDLSEIEHSSQILKSKGYRRVSPYFVPKILLNLAAGHVSIKYSCRGPIHTPSTACATGANAIGDAARFIQHGDAKIMIAGASEACITPLAMMGFHRAKALSTSLDPTTASRPFDQDRQGFVMGEGAGIVILEELEFALKRKAKIYAEVRGYGLAADAYHCTAPSPDGYGAKKAMMRAIETAGLSPDEIQYINAHATSTPIGDDIEARAISELFPKETLVSSTKGATGHLLGAAGALEAIITLLSLHYNKIPPTINLHHPNVPHSSSIVKEAMNYPIRAALSNSFGFGGINCSLCFKKL